MLGGKNDPLGGSSVKMQHSTTRDSSVTVQISKYLDNINDYDCDALTFWSKNQEHLPQLHNVALKVLSVPASSALVEFLVEEAF